MSAIPRVATGVAYKFSAMKRHRKTKPSGWVPMAKLRRDLERGVRYFWQKRGGCPND